MAIKLRRALSALLFLLLPALAHGGYTQESSQSYLAKIILVIAAIAIPIGGFVWFRSSRNNYGEAPKLREAPSEPAKAAAFSSTQDYPRGSVFISYRRDDSADVTGRIHERLLQRFAKDVVFKDVDSIPLGIDFRQHLEGALAQCRVLIAVIGDRWVEPGVAEGKRRIDDPTDQLRIELEIALKRNIPVIPALVRKAAIPAETELPESLKALAYRNGIHIRPDPDFNGDMERLIKGIEPHLRH